MLTGDMPLVVGILGNAGFQLVVLLMLRHRRGWWTLAAVWHAVLNAFGNAFFFSMVSAADRDRLNLLLGLEYAVVAALALAVFRLASRRGDDRGPELEPARAGRGGRAAGGHGAGAGRLGARPRAARRRSRNGSASPATCTTSSRTRSAWSRCRPPSASTSPRPTRRPPPGAADDRGGQPGVDDRAAPDADPAPRRLHRRRRRSRTSRPAGLADLEPLADTYRSAGLPVSPRGPRGRPARCPPRPTSARTGSSRRP